MFEGFSLMQPAVAVRPLPSDVSALAVGGEVNYDKRRVGLGEVLEVSDCVPPSFPVRAGDRVIYHMGLVKPFPVEGLNVHLVYYFDVEAVVGDGVRVDVDS